MTRPIGYYVHHHGEGHRQRALSIAQAAGGEITVLGTGLAGRTDHLPYVDLADDRFADGGFDGADHVERPCSLHYAPIDHEGVRLRVAQLTDWFARSRPSLLVVDVSVEVAMLARLASVPTIYVRLNGRRFDRPHLDAFRGASALLAPFHADLDDDRTPEAIRRRTFYAPGIVSARIASEVDPWMILVVLGRGAGPSDGALWARAATAVPDMRWRVIGPCTVPLHLPSNLELLGWVDNVSQMIASAAIVVGAAGDGLVGSVIANRRPFICLPEQRPFGEQVEKARRLAALGAAIVCDDWPSDNAWPEVVRSAAGLRPERLAHLDDANGAVRVAGWLQTLAGQIDELRGQST